MMKSFRNVWGSGPYARAYLVCFCLAAVLGLACVVVGVLYLQEIVSHDIFAMVVVQSMRWMGILIIVAVIMTLVARARRQPIP